MTMSELVVRYCQQYDIAEDDFSEDDIIYLEDVFYSYCEHGDIPDFMRTKLCVQKV
jgi:hypothetical protein